MQRYILDLTKPLVELKLSNDSEVVGLFIGEKNNQVKTRLKIRHTVPGVTSRIKIKAVVRDEAVFDCEAMVTIENGAEFTDTFLKIDALVLSEKAKARAVPSLEIYEDEVKGGHGATIGMVDAEQIHYIMSRGISYKHAEKMLVDAFIGEMYNLM